MVKFAIKMDYNKSSHPLYEAALEARRAVTDGKTGHAIAVLKQATASRGAGIIASRLEAIAADYQRVLDSVMRAEEDPRRGMVVDNINHRVLDLVTMIEHAVLSIDVPTLYFSTVRYLKRNPGTDFATLHARLDAALTALADDPQNIDSRKIVESIGRDLFYRLWTGFPLSESAIEQVEQIIGNKDYPLSTRSQLVSALTLGQLEYYDERRLTLMLRLYLRSDERGIRLRALTGVLLSLWRYRRRRLSDKVAAMLKVVTDSDKSRRDIVTTYKQLIRVRDTDRITRKMTDEVIPEMLKLRPDIDRMSRQSQGDDPLSMDENPEWEEMLDRSGIKDRLMELSKMQEEGGDVFMSTFSSLKHFPFFSEMSNWFLPFDTSITAFAGSEFDDLRPTLDAIAAAPVLCDNDKYSMALAMKGLSGAQRSMIADRMSVENTQMHEDINTMLMPDDRRDENYVNKYVQDLYRFYKLFSRSKEMTNPFADAINLVAVEGLEEVFDDVDMLSLVAEFYFIRRYFDDAFEVFGHLERKGVLSLELFQKMGHCLRQRGDNRRALEYLLKADLIDGENTWTLRHIGAAYTALGEFEKAREFYNRALSVDDTDLRVYNALIGIDIELKQYRRAQKTLMALSVKELSLTPAMRARQARLSVLTGNIAEALVIYRELEDDGFKPSGLDLATRGHAEWMAGLRDDALVTWRAAIDLAPYNDMARDKAATEVVGAVDNDALDPVTRSIVLDIIS